MISYYSITMAAFASTVLANGVDVLGVSPVVEKPHVLEKREDLDCAASVLSSLLPPLPTNSDFAEWAETAGPGRFYGEGCEFTVPASFSDDYLEYYSEALEWATTVSAEAAAATDCGIDGLALEVSTVCSTSQTIYFEGASSASNGSVPSTVLPHFDFPAETMPLGTESAASLKKALAGPAVALALFVGVFAAL
jgi:hypothetical protein